MILFRKLSQTATAVVVFLICSVVLATAQQKKSPGKSDDKDAVAIVNGTRIPYKYYQQLRNDYHASRQSSGAGPAYLDQITDDDAFLQLIDAELISQEAATLGISVTQEQAMGLFLNNPPAYVRDIFVDASGAFQEKLFREVVKDPKKILQLVAPDAPKDKVVQQWNDDIDRVVRYMQYNQTRTRLIEALYAKTPLTPAEIKHRYFAEKTTVDGSFIRVLHSTVPDTAVSVTEEEARAWYDAHKGEYRVPEARTVGSVIIPVIPSYADSAALLQRIDSVKNLLQNTPFPERAQTLGVVLQRFPENRFPERPVSLREVPRYAASSLANATTGDVVGPFNNDDEYMLIYVEGTAPSRDTLVRARHILLKPSSSPGENDSAMYLFALTLRTKLEGEENFAEAARLYSQDGTAQAGGDLGYFTHGEMIPEFEDSVFIANKGDIIGPVRTPYGWHVIMVIDKVARNYALRELRFPIQPSQLVMDNIKRDAEEYAEALRSGKVNDSIAQTFKWAHPHTIFDTSLVKRLEPYGDALVTGEFAFHAQRGDVAVLPIPYNRIAIVELLKKWPGGTPTYDEISIYPISHCRRKKQLDMLEPRMYHIADSIGTEMMLGPLRELAPDAEVFLLENQLTTEPPDEKKTLLDSLVMVTQPGTVAGPVRGVHGFYFLRVKARLGPTESDYERAREGYTRNYMERYREALLNDLIENARAYASITDLRPTVRALIAPSKP